MHAYWWRRMRSILHWGAGVIFKVSETGVIADALIIFVFRSYIYYNIFCYACRTFFCVMYTAYDYNCKTIHSNYPNTMLKLYKYTYFSVNSNVSEETIKHLCSSPTLDENTERSDAAGEMKMNFSRCFTRLQCVIFRCRDHHIFFRGQCLIEEHTKTIVSITLFLNDRTRCNAQKSIP